MKTNEQKPSGKPVVHYDHIRNRTLPNPGTVYCGRPWKPRYETLSFWWLFVTCKDCLRLHDAALRQERRRAKP